MSDYVSQVAIPESGSTHTYDIKEIFPHYATCSTAAATAAKEVTIGNFTLYTGAWVVVKFANTNSAAVGSLTLNVDGTGAKPIKYKNASLGWAGQLAANRFTHFIYDGTNYQIIGDLDANTYDRTSVQTRIYAGTQGAKQYSIVGLNSDQRMESFTTTAGTGTSKAFNTSGKFLYPPTIMYHSSSSTVASGSVISNNVLYEQYPSVDMRYSCNITSSAGFTKYKPVYLECSFDDNGLWSPTTNGFTQTLASDKYYILIGCTYSDSIYQLALFAYNPMFYYNGTNLLPCDWNRGNTTTTSIGSASAGQAIPADDITDWSAGTVASLTTTTHTVPNVTGNTSVTIPNVIGNTDVTIPNVSSVSSVSIPNVTGSTAVSIPNVTGNTAVSIPNVTGNTSVTVKSVKTVDTPTTAKISSGVLTFTKGTAVVTEDKTATNTTLGTALSASKVTLGTALSASKVTLGTALSASKVTMGDDLTASKVTLGTALSASKVTLGTAFSIKAVNVWTANTLPSLSYTAKSIPNISVTSVTNVLKKK